MRAEAPCTDALLSGRETLPFTVEGKKFESGSLRPESTSRLVVCGAAGGSL